MSCHNWTHCSAIVDLASYSSLAVELGSYPTTRETDVACDQSPKRRRSGLAGNLSKSRAHRHEVRSGVIPDSTQTVPEYVWGDEGPIND